MVVTAQVPEPEKSMAPLPRMESSFVGDSQPWDDHSQCATTGYTQVVMMKE